MIEHPFYPIIYLRGYAGSKGEIADTVSTPYMGFNLGSTKLRQLHTREVKPHVFESPLIRLMKDHCYKDAYHDGQLRPEGPVPSRSIWVFRYYDIADKDFGDGRRREIEYHARKLQEFLLHVRGAVLREEEDLQKFRAYLVAHSMGGLICRCYLQNPEIPNLDGSRVEPSDTWEKKGIDKLFTYGTPHGGIEFRRGLGWAEGLRDFLDPNNAGSFGPKRMRSYLDLRKKEPLNSLGERYPVERVFCVVGTDSRDYGAAAGLSKRAVGPLSDGLVLIKNASVRGAARAYVHRSHSGHYGLVNSESAYQNLRRFLFGDWRVVVEMTNVTVSLPDAVQEAKDDGQQVRASYHINVIYSVRGVPVELSRRTYSEESALFREYDRLTSGPTTLLTAFVMKRGRDERAKEKGKETERKDSLGFALRLQIRVPEYEVDGVLRDDHYEGGVLFADKLNIEVTPAADQPASIHYGWDSCTPGSVPPRASSLALEETPEGLSGSLPFSSPGQDPPRTSGDIRLTVTPWNVEPNDDSP